MASKRIGILGGSFDPVHRGHIQIAAGVARQLELEEIRLIPCAQHALGKMPGASANQRKAMLEQAIQCNDYQWLSVDGRELQRQGVSYSITTCREIRQAQGAKAVLAFIIGSDLLNSLHRWRDWEQLFDVVNLVVVDRAERAGTELLASSSRPEPAPAWSSESYITASPVPALKQRLASAVSQLTMPHGQIVRLTLPPFPISSTTIRQILPELYRLMDLEKRATGSDYAEILANPAAASLAELQNILNHLLSVVDYPVLSYIIAHELYR